MVEEEAEGGDVVAMLYVRMRLDGIEIDLVKHATHDMQPTTTKCEHAPG